MKDYETTYTPQFVPPLAKNNYFIVLVECGLFTYAIDYIFSDYKSAVNSKVSSGFGVSDSYVGGFKSEKEAQNMLDKYKKWKGIE